MKTDEVPLSLAPETLTPGLHELPATREGGVHLQTGRRTIGDRMILLRRKRIEGLREIHLEERRKFRLSGRRDLSKKASMIPARGEVLVGLRPSGRPPCVCGHAPTIEPQKRIYPYLSMAQPLLEHQMIKEVSMCMYYQLITTIILLPIGLLVAGWIAGTFFIIERVIHPLLERIFNIEIEYGYRSRWKMKTMAPQLLSDLGFNLLQICLYLFSWVVLWLFLCSFNIVLGPLDHHFCG